MPFLQINFRIINIHGFCLSTEKNGNEDGPHHQNTGSEGHLKMRLGPEKAGGQAVARTPALCLLVQLPTFHIHTSQCLFSPRNPDIQVSDRLLVLRYEDRSSEREGNLLMQKKCMRVTFISYL